MHEFISEAIERFVEWNKISEGDLDVREAMRQLSDVVKKEQIENNKHLQEIHIQDVFLEDFDIKEEEKFKIRIGLANMKVKWEHAAEYSLRGRPLVNLERLDR